MVELLVRMDCSGCERKIRKQLAKIKGIDNVEVDLRTNKVTVTGYVDRRKVLKAVRKTGKRAEFWLQGYRSSFYGDNADQPYTSDDMMQTQAFRNTYNYRKHGYNEYGNNGNEKGSSSSGAADPISDMFSDENPNACFIM